MLIRYFLLTMALSFDSVAVTATNNVRGGRPTSEVVVNSGSDESTESAAALFPPPEPESLVAMQFSPDPYRGQSKKNFILSGQFSLVHVHISPNGEVHGVFCEFQAQRRDPSRAPRFLDLYGESTHCQEHGATFPLHGIAEACRERDLQKSSRTSSVEPTAFIFHQPKSGSTLLTNMIAVSNDNTQVVSEPNAIHEIVNCRKCSDEMKQQALQDTIYLLGRSSTNDNEQQLYIKLSASVTAAGLPLITDTYPDTKWLFVHRDLTVILQKLVNHRSERRQCAENRKHNPGPHVTQYLASQHNIINAKRHIETAEQACAAYLATNVAIVQEAMASSSSTTAALKVSYETDLTTMANIQRVFDFLEVKEPQWERVEQQRNKHALGGADWKGEAALAISSQVASATAEFAVGA